MPNVVNYNSEITMPVYRPHEKAHTEEMLLIPNTETSDIFWILEIQKYRWVFQEYFKTQSKGIKEKPIICGNICVIMDQRLIYEDRVEGGANNV